MNIHTLVDIESVTMILVNFLVKSFIPTIPIIVFNAILYKRLKALLNSGSFNFGCNSELQKSVFRAKVTILIAFIFVSSQILLWIQIFIILVCTFHGNFQICQFMFTFQVHLGRETEIRENPYPWGGMIRCLVYFRPIIKGLKVLNISAPFFAYKYLIFKEKELKRKMKQDRELNRTTSNTTTRLVSTGNTSTSID